MIPRILCGLLGLAFLLVTGTLQAEDTSGKMPVDEMLD